MKIPTLDEDPQFWEKMADTPIMRAINLLSKSNKCPFKQCGYREKDGWIVPHPGQIASLYALITKFLIHYKTTHGVDPEFFIAMLKDEKLLKWAVTEEDHPL